MEKPDHQHYMKEAIKQAVLALEKGEVPVGAVVVWKNKIVARAHNQMETLHDPTAHAEMIALTQASETLCQMPEAKPSDKVTPQGRTIVRDHRGSLEGATLYVTLEPCPMCAGALVMTKCTNLIFGARDPRAGACHSLYHITEDDRLNHQVKVTGGVMADDAKFLLAEFFKTLRKEKR
ncbi:MAG TPA: nucleoside deaminase [Candidatus Omnitrophota bacterium]|nr:nucleoside deaminase [Candidatus Omnitrophota bacterium]HPS36597.1 nucleoside deaminase [Candidatus Omnitrophota bacterium]